MEVNKMVKIKVISIHAPREGGDSYSSAVSTPYSLFQSTPPARGATTRRPKCC